MSVLVEGNKIRKIAKSITPPGDATVIDGGGLTLMPGLIDAHVHLYWNVPAALLFTEPQDYLYALALREGAATLMRGYTTVRDISGSVFGVKRAFDEGLYPGPRIYASGPGIGTRMRNLALIIKDGAICKNTLEKAGELRREKAA